MALRILWFRRDLRVTDNAAMAEAIASGDSVLPVAVVESAGMSSMGAAAFPESSAFAGWRIASLHALSDSLAELGSRLIVRSGIPATVLAELARKSGAASVVCTRDWAPSALAEERAVATALENAGATLEVAEGSLLVTPDALTTAAGGPYRVFTPYFRAWEHAVQPAASGSPPARGRPARPDRLSGPDTWPRSDPLPEDPRALDGTWSPGERGARVRLDAFIADALEDYADGRDRPDLDATSRLSPHLAHGEITPHAIVSAVESSGLEPGLTRPFLRQLAWREFAYNVMHAFPGLDREPLRPEFCAMPWLDDESALAAWRAGMTGFPLVDAGMRQLACTGWMHNRVRLVVASLLTKHLLVDWRAGLEHFARTLADHDPAANAFNWQWVAGSGADAAPYFRVFNPTLQAQRFDPHGNYIRTWVPELAALPDAWVARPSEAPADVLAEAGVVLGKSYPSPIVDHQMARRRALAAYEAVTAHRGK